MTASGTRRVRVALAGALVAGATCLTGAGSLPAAAADGDVGRADSVAQPVTAVRKGMPGVWWYDAMALEKVHAVATGKGVKVAVIDGYLDPKVPDLRGAEISKSDSCRGNPVPYLSGEIASHGTAMTTAIVGQGADGKGIVGVAPDAEVRFFSFDDNPDKDLVECDAVLIRNQMEKAIAWGADVISMSIGTGTGLEDTIEKAWDAGAVVVAASGARQPGKSRGVAVLENPAAMAGVVAVAAAGSDGTIWKDNPYSFEEDDVYLTLAAPGVDVPLGGFPEGSDQWLAGGPRTGTSPATAITAGAFAVLKSRWPEATNNQLIQAFIHTASGESKKGRLIYDNVQGYGLIKLRGALDEDPTGWPDENPLLLPPRETMQRYPASSYDLDRAQGGTDQAPEQTDDQTGAQDEGASAQAGSDTTSASDEDAAAQDGPGVPVWAVALGVLLLALAVGALLLRRRSTAPRPTGTTDTTHTTHDHPAPRGS